VYTYFGLLDDFAERHRDAHVASLSNLNNHLLTAALFDGPLLVNDGYLLNHPVLRQAVIDPNSSPLCRLVESGFVKILTRNERQLGVLADEMAAVGIGSAQRLLRQRTYRRNLKPALDHWTERLKVGGPEVSFRNWPRANISQLFTGLATTALDQAIDRTPKGDAQKTLVAFQKVFRAEGPNANRTAWEKAADHQREEGKLPANAHKALMLMGNEAYQYAWGCALSEHDKGAAVLTRAPLYLNLDRSVAQVDLANLPEGVIVYGPDIAVAGKRVGKKWELLAEIVRSGAPMTYRKTAFLDSLRRYYAGDGGGKDEVERTAKAYSNALAEHFGSRRRGFVFAIGSTLASTAVGAAAAGPIGVGLGLGIGLFTNAADYSFGPKLLARVSAPFGKPWITKKRSRLGPVTSSFQLDPEQVAIYLAGVDQYSK
jgi:hypothetical protein